MVTISIFLLHRSCYIFFFFFQAEDGIRDYKVTGVQTCALPICLVTTLRTLQGDDVADPANTSEYGLDTPPYRAILTVQPGGQEARQVALLLGQIGRASCRKECRSRWSPYH